MVRDEVVFGAYRSGHMWWLETRWCLVLIDEDIFGGQRRGDVWCL